MGNSERKRLHADDMTKDDALEILGASEQPAKKQKVAPTEEEQKRRAKRAERFGEHAAQTRAAEAKPTTDQKSAPLQAIEETEEEKQKRKKREDRFNAPAPAQAKANSSSATATSEAAPADASKAAPEATTGESAAKG